MPRIERHADVAWSGNVARGNGSISAGTGAFDGLGFSLPTRISKDGDGKTSPEELVAAAHAGCFAMSLAGELREADPAIDVRATIVMDEVEGKGHVVVESQLRVRTRADVDEQTFRAAVEAADAGCPISQLIRGTARVTIDAELED
jgi:osmotically inducible protein OsmC